MYGSDAGNHRCCEFMYVVVLSCSEGISLWDTSLPSDSLVLPPFPFLCHGRVLRLLWHFHMLKSTFHIYRMLLHGCSWALQAEGPQLLIRTCLLPQMLLAVVTEGCWHLCLSASVFNTGGIWSFSPLSLIICENKLILCIWKTERWRY